MTRYLLVCLFLFPLSVFSQNIDHWETVVQDRDIWAYFVGTSEPPSNWMQPSFDDSIWPTGMGGFGYGDEDDGTQTSNTICIYLRQNFELVDTAVIVSAILHADYDDAFVAYLNGVEIARNNIGNPGDFPAYNERATGFHEADLYRGDLPDSYTFSSAVLKNLIKQGTNTLAFQVHNESINSSDLSSNFFFSIGITDASMNYAVTPSWFIPPFETTNLPLFVIQTDQNFEIQNEPKIRAHMGIVDNGFSQRNSIFDAYNGYDGAIAIEIRGASSQSFPKKNYSFETQKSDSSNNNVSLLGLPKENDWILHGPYSDKSLLRNVLAYHMGTVTGQYTPRTRLCELIINGDYRGVYMLTEKIKQDKNRVDIRPLESTDIQGDALTGGYIFQIDRDDESTTLDGWESSYAPNKFFAYNDPHYEDLTIEQREYLKNYIRLFEAQMNSPSYTNLYKNFIDQRSWVDYMLISEIGKHIDAYKLSFYMHKKNIEAGGKLHFGPLWDFNLAFGNFDFACSPEPTGWSYEWQGTCDFSHPFWVKKLMNIPQVRHEANCRWKELRAGALHTDSLMSFIDSNALLLDEGQDRNFNRWPTLGIYLWPNSYIGDSYQDEIDFLKSWLFQRLNWMDANMVGDCNFFVSNHEEEIESNIHIYPNPAKDYLIVEMADFQDVELQLYNGTQQLLQSNIIRNTSQRIEFSGLTPGLYFYHLKKGNVILSSGKVIIVPN